MYKVRLTESTEKGKNLFYYWMDRIGKKQSWEKGCAGTQAKLQDCTAKYININ